MTSATPRDHGDSTSGRQYAGENDGGQLDDVTDDVTRVDVTSCWDVDIILTRESPP